MVHYPIRIEEVEEVGEKRTRESQDDERASAAKRRRTDLQRKCGQVLLHNFFREKKPKRTPSRSSTSAADTSERPRGMIRVAKYYPGKPVPKTPGYRNVLIHLSDKNIGGDLSPYLLKDENGRLLENIWQFSKLYEKVDAQRTPKSRFYPDQIIWEHPEEVHLVNDEVQPAYWEWRKKGMENAYAVRYPNGYHGRHQCKFCLWPDSQEGAERLDYIEARKKVYCAEYARLGVKTPHFTKLQAMLEKGVNLQIIEVDGPNPDAKHAPFDRISPARPGLLIDEKVIRMLVNDPRQPFGHGYVVAALLLGHPQWME